MKRIIVLFTICSCAYGMSFAQTTVLNGGAIVSNHYSIRDTIPVILENAEAASGGSAPIAYSWESSGDNLTWTPVPDICSDSYEPRAVSGNTYFRRKATSEDQIAYSNTVALSASNATGATSDANYIATYTYTAKNNASHVADINYYNDMGYPSQNIQIGASPDTQSIVTPFYYDAKIRESRKYLPYVTNGYSGLYRSDAFSEQTEYYNDLYGNNEGNHSYTESLYDASPLNRATASYNAGAVFRTNDGKRTLSYETNTENEVAHFIVDSLILSFSGFCLPHTLFKIEETNEDGIAVVTYKDFMERTVLERAIDVSDSSTTYDTYYVYDDRGNLCYVLPPELSKTVVSRTPGTLPEAMIAELAYVYKYDGRNRCIEKRTPGTDPTYMIYDDIDRLVMSQNGNMRNRNQWIYTEYDALDRPTRQSILVSAEAVSPSTLQHHYDVATSYRPYIPLNSGFSEAVMLSTTVYDAYVYEDEEVLISMNDIPVGTNIRGWTFRITRMDLLPESPVDAIYSMDLNGKEWMVITHYDGDNESVNCNSMIDATAESLDLLCDGGWSLPDDEYTFTIKDDQDYIVTKNDLPEGNETGWGFERVVRIRPR